MSIQLVSLAGGAGAGLLVGAFIPSILRKVKAAISSEEKKVLVAVETEAKKIESKL